MNPMEQVPKIPEVQMDLFPPEELPKPEAPEVIEVDPLTLSHDELLPLLEGLTHEQLISAYKKWVGKDPSGRGFDDTELRIGIRDPKAEVERLGAIDRAEDEASRNAPHYQGLR